MGGNGKEETERAAVASVASVLYPRTPGYFAIGRLIVADNEA
jgi:hypothetical protein